MADGFRLFGVDEANRLVPWLTSTFEQVTALAAQLKAVQDQLASGDSDRGTLDRRGQLLRAVQALVDPLVEAGLEVKGLEGLVDFRATRAGRVVYLCWRFPEREVAYWHELEAGFAGRRAIRPEDGFAPSYLS
jgi:hypothetical protein